jgi:hypothetical protein
VATGIPLKLQVWDESQHKYIVGNFGAWEHSWRLFLPALALGVPLYLCKRRHWGRPMYMFPAFILIPVGIFYVGLAAAGKSIDEMGDWFHPQVDDAPFWQASRR